MSILISNNVEKEFVITTLKDCYLSYLREVLFSNRFNKDAVALMNGMTPKQLAKSGFFDAANKSGAKVNISQYRGLLKRFERCQEGLSVIATIGAAILTTNLIVPILRNKRSKPAEKPQSELPKLSVKFADNLSSNKLIPVYPYAKSGSMKI